MQLLSLTIVTVIVVVVNCQPNRFRRPHQYHFPLSIIRQSKTNRNTVDTPKYNYTEEWYSNMPLDHFSFTTNRTFALRLFIYIRIIYRMGQCRQIVYNFSYGSSFKYAQGFYN